MNRIRELRQQRGLTQEQLADYLFVKQQAIYSYENDKYEPDITTLKKMASFFETSIDYIVELVDNPAPISKIKKHELTETEANLIETLRTLPQNLQKDFCTIVEHTAQIK